MNKINIAVDGPSGVGKSTVCDIVAEKLHMVHLDTGAMYRCVALYLKNNQIDLENLELVSKSLNKIQIKFQDDKVILNGEDVSKAIRTNEISMVSSKTSAIQSVREKMVFLQQEIAKDKGYILDGRDICKVVLPNAEVKIYLSASSEARAQRRYKEYILKGVECDYQTILDDINKRDYQDSHRSISPSVKAEDAIEIDTSNLTIEQVVQQILKLAEEKI